MTPGTGWQPSDEFLDRVKRAYRLSLQGWTGAGRSMWTGIFERQRPIHDALLAGEHDHLRAIFNDPGATDLFYGVDNLYASFVAQKEGSEVQQADDPEAAHLLRLCAFICAGDDTDPIATLDDALRTMIRFPNPFRGEYGVRTSRGVASYRALHAIYQSYRIKQIIGGTGRVLEIGPGAGRTAYYTFGSGIDYTTVDLPLGVVAQACFLGAALGEHYVWMLGDDPTNARGRIRILPVSVGLPDEQFDLVVNVDSLTEMSAKNGLMCVRWIATHAPRFLSVNHRLNHFTADEACRFAFSGRISYDSLYPMRDGYNETIFETGPLRNVIRSRAIMDVLILQRRIAKRASTILAAVKLHAHGQYSGQIQH